MSDVPREPFEEPEHRDPEALGDEVAQEDLTEGQLAATDAEVRNWAMLCHLSSLAGYFLAGVVIWTAPLILWLLKRNDHPFIDEHGKESLNFQITVTIYLGLCIPL